MTLPPWAIGLWIGLDLLSGLMTVHLWLRRAAR